MRAIVEDTEAAFDDGWPAHPEDGESETVRFRTIYLGGAGVVDALHRLAGAGVVETGRDYTAYLESCLDTIADSPDNTQAFRSRGLARMKLGQSAGALEDFLVVLKDEPRDAVANYQAAICLLASDRRDLARKFMQRVSDAAPNTDEGRKAKRWLENEPAPAGGKP